MKFVLTIILSIISLIFISGYSYGDNYEDSITNLIKHTEGHDKIKLILDLAYRLRLNKPEKTIELANRAFHLSDSMGDMYQKQVAISIIGLGYRYQGEYNKALKYQQKALLLAKQLNNKKLILLENNRIGIIYKNLGLLDIALKHYNKALEVAISRNRKPEIANMYNNIGNIYRRLGDLDKALEYYFKTLRIRKETNDEEGYAYILNNIGNVYYDLKLFDQALEYHFQSLETKRKLGNKYGLGTSFSNIGNVYYLNNKPQKALYYYDSALIIFSEMGDSANIASTYSYIGQIHLKNREYNLAEHYLSKAMDILQRVDNKSEIISNYIIFGNLYLSLNEYKTALNYFQKAQVLAEEEHLLPLLKNIYEKYSEVFSKMGQIEKAFYYYRKYSDAKDSIFNSEISKRITELEVDEKTEKFEMENKLLAEQNKVQELSLRQKNLLLYSLGAITLLILALIGLLFSRYRNKHRAHRKLEKSEKTLRELNATKDKFFSIIAHDLKNPFNAILGFSEILTTGYDTLSDDERKRMIKSIYEASANVYKLLQNLLEWSRTQLGKMEIKPELFDIKTITDENLEVFRSVVQNKNITLISEVKENTLVYADKNMINTVLRNLISNAIKFTHEGGRIIVSAVKKGDFTEVCVTDNGIGLSAENIKKIFSVSEQFQTPGTNKETGSGLGLLICKEFIESNNGKIKVESTLTMGSKFSFELPSKKSG